MTELRPIDDLQLDVRNPRMDLDPPTQEAAEDYLIDFEDVSELVQSIGNSGWQDYEPLIVIADGDKLTVLEGNRRLAALRVLTDQELQSRRRINVPPEWTAAAPDTVRVKIVSSREEARDFIGFKHINGPHTWDSMAKARFATDWLDDPGAPTLEEISLRLGDRNNTVRRLVNGYRVLEQAKGEGIEFGQPGRPISFSHLYTGISYPSFRAYLGLPGDASSVFASDPVPDSHDAQLVNVLLWLYGKHNSAPSVRSQNPDLTKLRKVLENETATFELERTGLLDHAYDIAEDKQSAFKSAVLQLRASASDALRLQSAYQGEANLLEIVTVAYNDVEVLFEAAKRKARQASAQQAVDAAEVAEPQE